ncbi:hypothetical protein HF526_30695, partial [Pseudonocardia sp. K10HN5]|nr:hypothetical protein [Pseudonocardia acidicola]
MVAHDERPPGAPGGLEASLGRLVHDSRVIAAALVDYDSGMALQTYAAERSRVDLEYASAGHAELVRTAVDTFRSLLPASPPTEIVVSHRDRLHHLMRPVPDPLGDRLVLTLLVSGPERGLRRIQRRLRAVDLSSLAPRPAAPAPAPAPVEPASPRGPEPFGPVQPPQATPALPARAQPMAESAFAVPAASTQSGAGRAAVESGATLPVRPVEPGFALPARSAAESGATLPVRSAESGSVLPVRPVPESGPAFLGRGPADAPGSTAGAAPARPQPPGHPTTAPTGAAPVLAADTGRAQPGPAQPGSGQSGSAQTGSGQPGSAQPAPGRPGSAQAAPVPPGPVQPAGIGGPVQQGAPTADRRLGTPPAA